MKTLLLTGKIRKAYKVCHSFCVHATIDEIPAIFSNLEPGVQRAQPNLAHAFVFAALELNYVDPVVQRTTLSIDD